MITQHGLQVVVIVQREELITHTLPCVYELHNHSARDDLITHTLPCVYELHNHSLLCL